VDLLAWIEEHRSRGEDAAQSGSGSATVTGTAATAADSRIPSDRALRLEAEGEYESVVRAVDGARLGDRAADAPAGGAVRSRAKESGSSSSSSSGAGSVRAGASSVGSEEAPVPYTLELQGDKSVLIRFHVPRD
jgi:hypothetical protein